MTVFEKMCMARKQQVKQFAVLIDPDKCDATHLRKIIKEAEASDVDYFFVGGSLMESVQFKEFVAQLKSATKIPVVIFPGSVYQVDDQADAILLLSLISGRNPELLIGKHVEAAPLLKSSGLEIISTGYLLVDGGRSTTVSYISQTTPIPADKYEIAYCTALAGNQLGLSTIYMDAGSGANQIIHPEMVQKVRKAVDGPLIVGGGIRTTEEARKLWDAGADVVVVGNAIEKESSLIDAIGKLNRISMK